MYVSFIFPHNSIMHLSLAYVRFAVIIPTLYIYTIYLVLNNKYGLLQAYDQHLNMILGDVEETVTTTEIDDETDEEIVKKQTRKVGMLFVRGDIVVLISPPLRAG
jgi:small nuclear ribonucleoprotein (snRNP)-like protein